jgi:hypothetical protein
MSRGPYLGVTEPGWVSGPAHDVDEAANRCCDYPECDADFVEGQLHPAG